MIRVAQKGISANLLKVGSKRRRRKTDKIEDQEEMSVREKIQEEVERQTKNLKNQLAQREAEAQNNQNAASILSQFINSGDAEIDEMGKGNE